MRTIIPDTEFHPRDFPRGTEIIEMTDLIIQVAITVGSHGVSSLPSPFSMADEPSLPQGNVGPIY